MEEISKAEQIAIIQDELRAVEQLQYRLGVRARVRSAIGDTATVEQLAKDMERNELIRDKYLEILKELEEGTDES